MAIAVLMAGPLLHAAATPVRADALRVRVLHSELIGRYVEDIDHVPPGSGAFSNHIVILNGREVHGLPANAAPDAPIRALFDLRQQVLGNPSGIAYVASENLFAVVDSNQRGQLFFVDHGGRPQPPRPIRYLDGYFPLHVEGLAYIPQDSPRFPAHLLMLAWDEDWWETENARIEVIRTDGQVVAEIPLREELFFSREFYGIAFRAPDRILLTGPGISMVDFDGALLWQESETYTEGITQLADGRIVVAYEAQLQFSDADLHRLPAYDRDAGTTIGLVLPESVAWDADGLQHLVLGRSEGPPFLGLHAAGVPLRLNAASTALFELDWSLQWLRPTATYMPDEHRIAVGLINDPPEEPRPLISLFDRDGQAVEVIDASAIGPPGFYLWPNDVVYVPSTREFVVAQVLGEPSRMKFLTRSGALVREIDLAPIGIGYISAMTYFDAQHPSGGRFLVFDPSGRAVVLDFRGNLLAEFDYRAELGLSFVKSAAAITSGAEAGAFTALETGSSPRIVLFTIE
jgi:hypothetical protein